MKHLVLGFFALSMVGMIGCVADSTEPAEGSDEELAELGDIGPTAYGKAILPINGSQVSNQAGGKPVSNGISYHGGPVMTNAINLYYIWYGDWSGNTGPSILNDFANNVGASSYWNIAETYYNGSNTKVSGSVSLAGSTSVAYPYGTSLSDAQIFSVVTDAIGSGALPKDANGIYFVLTSADVTAASGFCTQYCGWHDSGTYSGATIKYSFVGNADRCPSSCAAQTTSPNGNAGADAMVSIVAHEAVEAASDPELSAWWDNRGYENADKCAWTWGTTYNVANGSKANVKMGARDFLIQRNWVNAGGGYCSMTY